MTTKKETATRHIETASRKSCEVQVRFGRMSMDCQNFGFCRIEPSSQWKGRADSKMANATMSYHLGKLSFRFEKGTRFQEFYGQYFVRDSFLVQEDYELPSSCCTKLGIDRFLIKKGIYSVKASRSTVFLNIH